MICPFLHHPSNLFKIHICIQLSSTIGSLFLSNTASVFINYTLSPSHQPYPFTLPLSSKSAIYFIFFETMIRVRPVIPKPSKRPSEPKPAKTADQQNQKPLSFNTRGYFDPTNISDADYLNEKQRVFEKYRSRKNEVVMLDIKNTNKSLLIHRAMLKPTTSDPEINPQLSTKHLLKSYLLRKERHISHQQEKYMEVPKLSIDTLSWTHTASSRTSHTRQMTSRISTATVLKIESDF